MSDTISDFITIIRNAYSASHASCTGLYSKVHLGIARILKMQGYITDFEEITPEKGPRQIKLTLKYVDDQPAIVGIDRVSTPGARAYCGYSEMPKVLGGLGINIISSSKGIIHDRQARKEKLGGEIICKVW
jgi:small subunit ribosomal protein S8